MKIIASLLVGLLFGATQLQAQVTPIDLKTLPLVKQPLPPGPPLAPAPDTSQWIVTSFAVPGAPTNPNVPPPTDGSASHTVSKSAKVYRVESHTLSIPSMTRWDYKQMQATYLTPGAPPEIDCQPNFVYFIDFSKSDYPDFFWVSPRDYVGVGDLGGVKVLIFKHKVEIRSGGPSPMQMLSQSHSLDTPMEVFAAIDLVNHRPVMLQVENELLIYQYPAKPPELTLPKEVVDAFASKQKILDRGRMPSG